MHVPTNLNLYGLFEPSDIEEMCRELTRGDVAGETSTERALRAAAILQRRMIPEIRCRARPPKKIKSPVVGEDWQGSRSLNARRQSNKGPMADNKKTPPGLKPAGSGCGE